MYEDRPEKDTPPSILKDLRAYGGLSPDGQPIWRLVLAENCRIHCFGTQNHISQGRLAEISKNDDPQQKGSFNPDRIEEGEFWVPRFRKRGWILQRWFPAHVWGTRDKWESEKARDGRTRLLAAYPQRGEYMLMAGPWKTIAEAGDLHQAIRCYNVQQRNNPVNWPNHILTLAKFEEIERQEAADAYAHEISAQHRIGVASSLRTVSGAAQKFRNVVAQHTAGGINLGASEKWG
jgi:hypothetical protein